MLCINQNDNLIIALYITLFVCAGFLNLNIPFQPRSTRLQVDQDDEHLI